MKTKILTLVFAFTAFTAWSGQCPSHKAEAKDASAKPAKACCGKCKSECTKSKAVCTRAEAACTKSKCGTSKCPRHEAKHTISTEALKKALENKEELVILDARSGKGDDGRRIPGAKQLAPTADAETIKAVAGGNKNAKIITYCSNLKCGASAKLAAKLKKEGYTNVTEYPKGIAGWTEAGNSVDENKK